MEIERSLEEQIAALKMSNPKMFAHPETQEGEIWISNNPSSGGFSSNFHTIRFGDVAYGPQGKPMDSYKPVFMKVKEYLEHQSKNKKVRF